MKVISVIIVSWNARQYLRGCLDSLRLNGSSLIQEIIVVDNSSSDGSPEMVESEFKEVTLIRAGGNLGFARANNLGISQASGEVLALINSDVVLHRGCFESLTDVLASHPEAGLVGPKVIGGDGKLQPSCRRLPSIWNILCRVLALDAAFPQSPLFAGRERPDLDPDKMAEVEVLSGCFWVARGEAVKKVGGLDERFFFYAEDVDWCKRFRAAGWTVLYVPAGEATHFGGGSSSNAPLRYSIEILRANLLYWRKHHGLYGWVAYYLLSVSHHFLRFVPRGLKRLAKGRNEAGANQKFDEDYTCLRWLLTGRGV